jgi:hypothetical protein
MISLEKMSKIHDPMDATESSSVLDSGGSRCTSCWVGAQA